ncbi:hypothetical protein [Streptomyces malaysiensis]|uniref:hypothetical protein n=1 Tax=Streptomyces malaysiensis TaxID=92644 RepID=UPI000853ED6A|nr:hypothetical protein [Streptomyces sp. SPMA113]
MVGHADLLMANRGFHAVAIDAPGHGGRPSTAVDEREIDTLRRTMAAGRFEADSAVRFFARHLGGAVPSPA